MDCIETKEIIIVDDCKLKANNRIFMRKKKKQLNINLMYEYNIADIIIYYNTENYLTVICIGTKINN